VGIFLGLFGLLHLVLAWGLFERESWARMLGLVIAFLALLRFPLGTALGIYTLWVLLPEESGAEYDRLARGDKQMNAAAVSP
jgi:protein-S-isoprenylcysteine O-methyltransferase Ste14